MTKNWGAEKEREFCDIQRKENLHSNWLVMFVDLCPELNKYYKNILLKEKLTIHIKYRESKREREKDKAIK